MAKESITLNELIEQLEKMKVDGKGELPVLVFPFTSKLSTDQVIGITEAREIALWDAYEHDLIPRPVVLLPD